MVEPSRVALFAVLVIAASCKRTPEPAGSQPPPAPLDASPTTASQSGGAGGADAAAEAASTAFASDPRCTPELRDVYALSSKKNLLRFAPATRKFTAVGPVKCDVSTKEPTFGIDRSGMAWMQDTRGGLVRVDVRTGGCSATKYVPRDHAYQRFTSAFTATGPAATTEAFYIADDHGWGPSKTEDSAGISTVDPSTLEFTLGGMIMDNEFIGIPCALAGNGLGKLYGVFAVGKIAVIDPKRRTPDDLYGGMPPGPPPPTAYWGGSLWLFRPFAVQAYRIAGSKLDVFAGAPPEVVVAAGSSTCAPLADL
jgi:hypothetical protein